MGLTSLTSSGVIMAMQQLTLPGEIVKKHNELVRSKINLSGKTASRILACLVASIRHDETQFKEAYTVPIKDYLPNEEGGMLYKQARAACKELASATVETEWPDPENPGGEPIFHVMPFFTSIKYRKGNVEARFNKEMSGLLLQLRACFTQYNLMEYLTLPSLYSQKLFEILKSWANTPEVVLPVAELHRLLNTPPSFRADFKAFRTRVIEKAHKDIQEKTSLRFEWESVKAGRSVEAIRFLFAPGRKAIAEKEAQSLKDQKRRRLESQRMMRALECARAKNGECVAQDNKRIVCKACMQFQFCEEIRRKIPRQV